VRPIRRILVAIKDPAAGACAGVVKAAQLARSLGAEIILFHAISAPLYLDGDISLLNDGIADAERCAREPCLRRLEATATRLRRRRIKVEVSAQWDYPIHEAILREAERVDADLIVAAQHAGRRFAPGLLHLTDWELLRLSPVPVLLVKRPGPYRRPVVLAALDPDHTYSKPLQLDDEVLQAGTAVASALHGALHAVHAYVPLPVTALPYGTLSEDAVRRLDANSAAAARRKLARAVQSAKIPKSQCHIVGRHPSDAIEETAAATGSSILVMGAIARSGFKRLLIGNIAERVLGHVPCDVLVVKPAGFRRQVPAKRRGAHYVSLASVPGM
jgi:universal stress protein E